MKTTYKKRAFKKARTKKKVFRNKKRTYKKRKRTKNKRTRKRKRGGMPHSNDDGNEDGDDERARPRKESRTDYEFSSTPQGQQAENLDMAATMDQTGLKAYDIGSEANFGPIQDGDLRLIGAAAEIAGEPVQPINEEDKTDIEFLFDDVVTNDILLAQLKSVLKDSISDDEITSILGCIAEEARDQGTPVSDLSGLQSCLPETEAKAESTGSPDAGYTTPIKTKNTLEQRIKGVFQETPTKIKQLIDRTEKTETTMDLYHTEFADVPSTPSRTTQPLQNPQTPEIYYSTSLTSFIPNLVTYLNLKSPAYKLGNVTIENCYEKFIEMCEQRGFVTKNLNSLITTYFKTRTFEMVDDFSREDFYDFMSGLVTEPTKREILGIKGKDRRVDFTGDSLASATATATGVEGGYYLWNYKKHYAGRPDPIPLEPAEIDWIKVCIEKRSQLWIDNPYFQTAKRGPYYAKALADIKENIETTYREWTYWKQWCGDCWICRRPIYFYFITEPDDVNGKRIYLNTQCGEDEHTSPPLVGDVWGLLNMDPSIMTNTMEHYGKDTLYSYGLLPSHAFCNQLKKMFIFMVLLKLFKRDDPIDVEAAWKRKVADWFEDPRYQSYEFYPGFVKSWDPGNQGKKPEDIYASVTYPIVSSFYTDKVKPILLAQARYEGHTIESVLKLKTLVHVIQLLRRFSKNKKIGPEFEAMWSKGKVAARDTGAAGYPSSSSGRPPAGRGNNSWQPSSSSSSSSSSSAAAARLTSSSSSSAAGPPGKVTPAQTETKEDSLFRANVVGMLTVQYGVVIKGTQLDPFILKRKKKTVEDVVSEYLAFILAQQL